jgi:glycerol uptake facilitator-like aquaporin
LASLCAAFALKGIFHPIIGGGVTVPSGSHGQAFALEFIISFNLMFVVTAVATDTRAVRDFYQPFSVMILRKEQTKRNLGIFFLIAICPYIFSHAHLIELGVTMSNCVLKRHMIKDKKSHFLFISFENRRHLLITLTIVSLF